MLINQLKGKLIIVILFAGESPICSSHSTNGIVKEQIWTSLSKELQTEGETLLSFFIPELISTSIAHFEQFWQAGPFLRYQPLVKQ